MEQYRLEQEEIFRQQQEAKRIEAQRRAEAERLERIAREEEEKWSAPVARPERERYPHTFCSCFC